MSAARQIVDAAFGGNYAKRLAMRGIRRRPPNLCDIYFGFAIGTSDEGVIEDNARERGIELWGDLTKGPWKKLADDIMAYERNAMKLLDLNGFFVREEGHSSGDELIGSAYLRRDPRTGTVGDWMATRGRPPHPHALKIIKLALDKDEPFSTTNGSIQAFKHLRRLYTGVSSLGRTLVDVWISFFDLKGMERELEYYEEYIAAKDYATGED
jgi:hypothetical protein